MFSPRNSVTETDTWGPRAADGTQSYGIVVKIANVPVEVRGTVTLTPTGENSCRDDVVLHVESGVPLVGGKLEDLVGKQVGGNVAGEVAFTKDWMASHS